MSNSAHAVVTLTDARVARGQAAWSRIKATAAEQRELWRDVGEALLVGRKQNPSNQGFSKWCKENGFGDMDRRDRADAMWLTEHWSLLSDGTTTPGLSHPHRIRVWFNEQKQTALLPADLSDIQAESIETIVLDERSAERIAKVIHRLPAGAGYMKGTPSPWSPRAKTSFIQGVEAQSHYTPRHGGTCHSNSSG